MEIYNTDTGETEELIYSHGDNEPDCLRDISAHDQAISYNRELARYEANKAAIAWWRKWIAAQEYADALYEAANEVLDDATLMACVDAAGNVDLEQQPAVLKRELLEACKAEGYELVRYDDGSLAFVAE